MLLVTARFVPGGRTVVTFSSGLTRQPFRRFLGFIAFAAVVWACYAALLGLPRRARPSPTTTRSPSSWPSGARSSVTGIIEAIRWVRHQPVRVERRTPAEVDEVDESEKATS